MSFLYIYSLQCAMCRAVLESGADQKAAEGLNDGIVYLMIKILAIKYCNQEKAMSENYSS